ncbi:MAG: acyltransferase [Methylacidiphilales bacterium]|nr:acyltransferase [Candidatus Methylacidiphilales bacterium]
MIQANPPVHRSADSHELRPLTGIRGIAAALVVLFHFYGSWILLLPSLHVLSLCASRGSLGVDLFFILSGFILSYVYHVNDRRLTLAEYGRFLWFRFARIYPNHLATLVILVGLVFAARLLRISITGDYVLANLPAQLTLTHELPFTHPIPGGQWNFPAWSIGAEWFAYVCIFPLAAYLMRWKWDSLFSLILAYLVLELWLFAPGIWQNFSFWYNPHLFWVSCEFFAGAMCFRAYLHANFFIHLLQKYASILFLILAVLFCFYDWNCPEARIVIVSVFPLLLIGLTSEMSLISKLLATHFFLWLGRVSYALYMSHALTEKFLKILLPSERYMHDSFVLRLLVFSINIAAIMAAAALLYYVVEVPSRNYLRKIRPAWLN